jgi:hypothetical protein
MCKSLLEVEREHSKSFTATSSPLSSCFAFRIVEKAPEAMGPRER